MKARKYDMCGLFGLIDYKGCLSVRQKEKIIKILSAECEVRGTDAAGVAYVENEEIKIYKRPLPAHKIKFRFKSNPSVIMGHTRMTTQGNQKFNRNNHPFYSEKLNFALAHNGVINNDKKLRKSEKLPQTNIQTDSYIAVQLIENKGTLNLETLKFMAEKVEGSFCFTLLDNDNNFYIVKGDNPIAVYDFGECYVYASTEDILNKALKKLRIKSGYSKITLSQGDILKLSADGSFDNDEFNTSNLELEYWLNDYYDRIYDFHKRKNPVCDSGNFDEEYFKYIVEYAKMIGVNEEDIEYLLSNGYDYFDIEEMLYEPDMLEQCLCEEYAESFH